MLALISCTGNCNKDNFPLVFSDVELVIREAPENHDFLQRFLPKLDWPALVDTARSVCPCRIYGVELAKSGSVGRFELAGRTA